MGAREDASDANRLSSVGYLPGECLTDANDKTFGIYHDWVHKNTGTHLDGGVEEDEKLQERC